MDWKSRAPRRTVNDIGFLRILTLNKCLITKKIVLSKARAEDPVHFSTDLDPHDPPRKKNGPEKDLTLYFYK